MFRNNKTAAPINAHSSYIIFDNISLPPGVIDCYLARQKPTYIHTVSTLVPFVYHKDVAGPPDPITSVATTISMITQLRFWNTNLQQLVAVDGTHFDFTPQCSHDIKNFTTRFLRLKSEDVYIVYLWYTTTAIYCASFSIYLPPWASFRTTTKLQGFSCGDTINDDIPSQFNAKFMIWDQWLANTLQYSTKSFIIPDLKGYNFIYQIAKQYNPSCMHCPTDLILQRPQQFKTETLHEFFWRTQDWLNL